MEGVEEGAGERGGCGVVLPSLPLRPLPPLHPTSLWRDGGARD